VILKLSVCLFNHCKKTVKELNRELLLHERTYNYARIYIVFSNIVTLSFICDAGVATALVYYNATTDNVVAGGFLKL